MMEPAAVQAHRQYSIVECRIDLTVSGDVIGGGISLDNHVHGGVESGGSNTAGPQ